jgi:hypothetical protein
LLELAGRFIQRYGLVLLCFCAFAGTIWLIACARLRRIRARDRKAREVEDALLQNAQGLILNVHGIVKDLRADDPMRVRMERALDRADEQLSQDRERVQDLRMADALGGELLRCDSERRDEPSSKTAPQQAPPAAESGEPRGRAGRLLRWLFRP